MANIQIIQGNFEKKLKLQFAPGIKAGFPSPADDYSHETLDFNRDLACQGTVPCHPRIFRPGYQYKRAGVIVMGICPDSAVQTNFIDYDSERYEKLRRLDEAIDRINRENGSETVVLGSQQYTAKEGRGRAGVFRDSIKHDFRSPSYTTKWSDIPEAE